MQRARSLCNTTQSDSSAFRVPARYRFTKLLGSGSYGVVAAFYDAGRGRDVAVKRVRRVFDNFLVLRRTLREIRLMRHFQHPNLLRLHKVLPLEGSSGDLYISLELMDGDLDTLIHSRNAVLSEPQVRRFTAQMLLGLLQLHSGHVIHRDLKPANIFVRLSAGQVKIGDLGLSRGIAVNEDGEATHPNDEMLTEYVVTRWYRAPEVLLARSKYGPPVDVWSVGCILHEMWARKALFPGKNSYDQLRRVIQVIGTPSDGDCAWVPVESQALLQRCCQPSSTEDNTRKGSPTLASHASSPSGADLLRRMCAFDPSKRATVEQTLQHQYLAGLVTQQEIEQAKDIEPADVAYDMMFDGIGRAGEQAALVQLGRLLRREIATDPPAAADATSDHSPVRKHSSPKDEAGSARGTPQRHHASASSTGGSEALLSARSRANNREAVGSRTLPAPPPASMLHAASSAAASGGSRGSVAEYMRTQDALRGQPRRSSEPDIDAKARRSQQLSRNGSGAAIVAPGRRRASEPLVAGGAAAEQPPPPPAFYEEARASSRGASQRRSSVLSYAGVEGDSSLGARRSASRASSRQGSVQRRHATPERSASLRQSSAQRSSAQQAVDSSDGGLYSAAAASPRASPPAISLEGLPSRSNSDRALLRGGGGSKASLAGREPSPTQCSTRAPTSKPTSGGSSGFFEPPPRERAGSAQWNEAAADGRHATPEAAALGNDSRSMEAVRMSSLLDAMMAQSSPRASARELSASRKASGRSTGSSSRVASSLRQHSRGASNKSAYLRGLSGSGGGGATSSGGYRSAALDDELDFAVCEAQAVAKLAKQHAKRSITPRRSPVRNGRSLAATAPAGSMAYTGDDSPTPPWMEWQEEEMAGRDNSHSPAPAVPWSSSSGARRGKTATDLSDVARQWRTLQSSLEAGQAGGSSGRSSSRGLASSRQAHGVSRASLGYAY
eukprot:TRINITY_DN29888_c0_g1_i1.p1 TRINITY_DN29888_c0_g1~~TRINITY_DN29888_c0_g1_i1.p1  ORF type:complete len:953 (-),score=199.72 TRINITY_DN29888_c0_g1_i1:186-3044(-)